MPSWDQNYANGGWDWLEDGKQFLWSNESDGWRHFYIQSIDGTNPICITPGNFDVMKTARVDFKIINCFIMLLLTMPHNNIYM